MSILSLGFDEGRVWARVARRAEHLRGGEQPDQRHNDRDLVHEHHIVLPSLPAARHPAQRHALERTALCRLNIARAEDVMDSSSGP